MSTTGGSFKHSMAGVPHGQCAPTEYTGLQAGGIPDPQKSGSYSRPRFHAFVRLNSGPSTPIQPSLLQVWYLISPLRCTAATHVSNYGDLGLSLEDPPIGRPGCRTSWFSPLVKPLVVVTV